MHFQAPDLTPRSRTAYFLLGTNVRTRSSKFSISQLPEIRLVHVVEVRFQVHESRGQRIESVVGEYHGLRVFHFREGLEVEAEVALRVVALGSCDVGLVRDGFAGPETDTG